MAASISNHGFQYRPSVGVQTDAVPTPVDEFVAPAASPYAAAASPITVTEDVAPAPAPLIENVAPATPVTVNTFVAPTPVIEYIAPPPAVLNPSFYPSFSQPNDAITGLVNPQISIADETSQVVGSFPFSEDFAAPVY